MARAFFACSGGASLTQRARALAAPGVLPLPHPRAAIALEAPRTSMGIGAVFISLQRSPLCAGEQERFASGLVHADRMIEELRAKG